MGKFYSFFIMLTVKVQFYLPDDLKAPLIYSKNSNTTIGELIKEIEYVPGYEYVVFIGTPGDRHSTPLIDLNRSMGDYNLWHSDIYYICELTIYKKSDTDKYNVTLYNNYCG
jgi:hypothetical protein